MPDFDELLRLYADQMEDFWYRRANAPQYRRTIHIFGQPVLFESNHERVLEAASLAEAMYSTAEALNVPEWRVQVTIHAPGAQPAPPPERLVDLVHYAGADEWLWIGLAEWGNCWVDMRRGEAHALLAPSLADDPARVCQVLLNTILTNLISRHGYSMLHASALERDGRVLLLQAPHGAGKSTAASHLMLNGYRLVSDSMIYICERNGELWLGGFPVGHIKLRADVLPLFPDLAEKAEAEAVRDETKYRVALDGLPAGSGYREMIPVRRIEYCLLERWEESASRVEPLTEEELWPTVMVHSLHYDTAALWRENLRRIGMLLEHSNLHRLRVGSSQAGMLAALDALWTP
jgi:hypothetical protein